MSPADEDGFLKIKEAAERLGCSGQWVRLKIKSGDIQAVRLGHKTIRIPKAAFERYLSDHFVEGKK